MLQHSLALESIYKKTVLFKCFYPYTNPACDTQAANAMVKDAQIGNEKTLTLCETLKFAMFTMNSRT